MQSIEIIVITLSELRNLRPKLWFESPAQRELAELAHNGSEKSLGDCVFILFTVPSLQP